RRTSLPSLSTDCHPRGPRPALGRIMARVRSTDPQPSLLCRKVLARALRLWCRLARRRYYRDYAGGARPEQLATEPAKSRVEVERPGPAVGDDRCLDPVRENAVRPQEARERHLPGRVEHPRIDQDPAAMCAGDQAGIREQVERVRGAG